MENSKRVVAAVQMDVRFADVPTNTERVIDKIRGLPRGVDLAVFPECVLTGYCFESRQEALAESRGLDDQLFDRLAQACRDAGCNAVIGFLERDEDRLFNAQVLLGANGVIGSYRKIHLPGLGVDRFVDPGDREFKVIAAGSVNVGMAICYDSSFPETSRVLGLQGADVIALSTNWPDAAKRTAEIVPSARSMENHLYFVATNRIGEERGFSFCGMSSITGPDGVVLSSTGGDEELTLIAEIDLATAQNKQIVRTPGKHVIDRFADRRPEYYSMISRSV